MQLVTDKGAMTQQNQQSGWCITESLRSAWVSVKSDLSLCYALKEYLAEGLSFSPSCQQRSVWANAYADLSLLCTHTILIFVVLWLK